MDWWIRVVFKIFFVDVYCLWLIVVLKYLKVVGVLRFVNVNKWIIFFVCLCIGLFLCLLYVLRILFKLVFVKIICLENLLICLIILFK